MTALLNLVKKDFRKWLALGMILMAANLGSVAVAQDSQDIEPVVVEPLPQDNGSSSGSLSNGPWGGNTRPTTSGGSNTARPPSASRPGSTLDVAPPPDGPGNPDDGVPFDSNMNLAFLVVGLVFAFVVYKKRFAQKAEAVTK